MNQILEHPYLLVNTADGEQIEIENTLELVAKSICQYGSSGDIMITTPYDTPVLNTMGIYVDKCSNAEYMESLRPVLIEKQLEPEDDLEMDDQEPEISI